MSGDGGAVYEGSRYVALKDRREFRLTTEQLRTIIQGFYDARFFDVTEADLVPAQHVEVGPDGNVRVLAIRNFSVLDAECVRLTITVGAFVKTIQSNVEDLPSRNIWALTRLIDATAHTEQFVGKPGSGV
jgi:hypothetical protein